MGEENPALICLFMAIMIMLYSVFIFSILHEAVK